MFHPFNSSVIVTMISRMEASLFQVTNKEMFNEEDAIEDHQPFLSPDVKMPTNRTVVFIETSKGEVGVLLYLSPEWFSQHVIYIYTFVYIRIYFWREIAYSDSIFDVLCMFSFFLSDILSWLYRNALIIDNLVLLNQWQSIIPIWISLCSFAPARFLQIVLLFANSPNRMPQYSTT